MLIGIDIIDIERIKKAAARTPRFLERVFTAQEREYCFKKKDPFPSLAARFAAREALRKIDLVFAQRMGHHDSEVTVDENGKPHLVLNEQAQALAAEIGCHDFAISLSHSKEQAIAVVIASKG